MPNLKKILYALIITLALAAPAAALAENPDDKDFDAVFMAVTKLDLANNTAFTWWTEEIWAVQAYKEKGDAAYTTFSMLKLMTRDLHLISPLPLGNEPPEVNRETAALANDIGVRVTCVAVHPSMEGMLPGLMAFPKTDANGRALVSPEAKALTLTVDVAGEPEPFSYTWSLPVNYPDLVQDAYTWLDKQADRDPALLDEREFILTRLLPSMKFDITTGFIASPMPADLIAELADREVGDDPFKRDIMDQILKGNDFFIVVGMDSKQDPQRTEVVAGSVYAVNTSGNRVEQDTSALLKLGDVFDKDDEEEKSFVVFPHLGNTGTVKIVLTDPQTGAQSTFEWPR